MLLHTETRVVINNFEKKGARRGEGRKMHNGINPTA